MSSNSEFSGVNRRTLYRSAKRVLRKSLSRRWTGSRESLERRIRAYLRDKDRGYLLRLVQRQAFAIAVAGSLLLGTALQAEVPIELLSVKGGTGGFVITDDVIDNYSNSSSVSGAGDVNGDGLDDLIVAGGIGYTNVEQSFVVFGKASGAAVDLTEIALGTGGFSINRTGDTGGGGSVVSGAGDVNGDGLDDVIVSIDESNGTGPVCWVVFGKTSGTTVETSSIQLGTGGFVINGISDTTLYNVVVSGAGDVNGDGKDDLLIGSGNARANTNTSYVVFGKNTTTAVSLATVASGTGGFAINGIDSADLAGFSVSGAGDVNGDNKDDIIIGAVQADPGGLFLSGEAYVVFGKDDGDAVDLAIVADGTGGILIKGSEFYRGSGYSISGAGDVNGDGLDDLIIGDLNYTQYNSESYVVFSPTPIPMSVGVVDDVTGLPVESATLYMERTDAPLGIRTVFSGVDGGTGEGEYGTADSDVADYRIRVAGPGYIPSDLSTIRTEDSPDTEESIILLWDNDLAYSNIIKVTIDLLDSFGESTGLKLLTDSINLSKEGNELDIDSIYGIGEMIFLGLPSGIIDITIPDTATFDFGVASVLLNNSVTKEITIIARLIDSPLLTRSQLPGQIVGTVTNTAAVPEVVLPNALLLSTQTSSGITTFTQASGSGVYFFPNIVPGLGDVEAFSENGNIRGTTKPVDIVTGAVFGDEGSEDADLSVRLAQGDTDFDGLPDEFENTYFGSPTSAQTANGDFDGDGLSNVDEMTAGTDPTVQDSDGDGANDKLEIVRGSNPNDINSKPVTWVNFGFGGGIKTGAFSAPFSTMDAAVAGTPAGFVINIRGDVSVTVGDNPAASITSAMKIKAYRGQIRIE